MIRSSFVDSAGKALAGKYCSVYVLAQEKEQIKNIKILAA